MSKKNSHNPDYSKNKSASTIKLGSGPAVPNQQWEINMNLTPDGKPNSLQAFDPMLAKDRPCMYKKTNECDH